MGKIFGDRGYISETLKDKLGTQGIEFITYHRKNIRQVELSPEDEIMLSKKIKTFIYQYFKIFSLLAITIG